MLAAVHSLHATSLSFSDLTAFPQAAIVNDSVMGGVSNSSLMAEGDFNRFSGRVRLENNGGFASVRFLVAEQLPNSNKVSLRVKGDGKQCQLRFRMGGAWQGVAYSVNFQTMDETWQTFDFYVSDFLPVWRGRIVNNAPKLAIENVQQVSVFIADKQVGSFSVLLDSVSFLGNS